MDGSRVVRASLARCVRNSHAVCEEHDGDSAWQSLVLDASIVAVISGLDITGVDGAGLVERIRASKLTRINGLPFYLLASDSLPEADRQRARQLGVTAFIPKAAPTATLDALFNPQPAAASDDEMAAEVGMISDIDLGDFGSRIDRLAGLGTTAASPHKPDESERQRAERTARRCLEQHLEEGADSPMASVLIFGIDGYAELCARFGPRVGEKVVNRFSGLLGGKIRAQESVLHLADGRIGIVSGNIDREQCAAFARRVCKALAAATLSLGGQQVKATVSAGVAAVPQDGSGLSAEELFYLATSRLEAAAAAGGNQVVHASVGARNLRQEEFIARLKGLLKEATPAATMSCKSWLRSICSACRDSRPDGEPAPCSASLADGLCGNRQAADR
ncbi:MAG TPA: diguanylate cyclase [Azonexus sp.]